MISWKRLLRRTLVNILERLPEDDTGDLKGSKKREKLDERRSYIPIWLIIVFIFIMLFSVLFVSGNFGFSWLTALGLMLLVSVIMALMMVYFRMFDMGILISNKYFTLMGMIMVLMVLLMVMSDIIPFSPYLVPVAGAGMVLTILLKGSTAFIVVLSLCIVHTLLNEFNFMLFFVSLTGSMVGIYHTQNVVSRKEITRSGMMVSLTNIVTMSIMTLITHEPFIIWGSRLPWVILNGFVSVIFTIGLLPYLESVFSLTTNIRLLEQGDFNQPILKRLMLEAPGTYHHSLLVANLAEAAADVIGANSLLARVGAYYHDIGKLKKPEYFIENQASLVSKHTDLNPSMSSLVVISHVKDGIDLARKNNIDSCIVDFIAQHHGTGLIHFFYQKALEAASDSKEVDEANFRYPGPTPKTRETAICMLADSVEAAVRTLEDPTHSRIADMVTKIINNKFIDGQLNECNLSLTSLHSIAESFIHTLTAVYHSRIEYPEEKEIEKRD